MKIQNTKTKKIFEVLQKSPKFQQFINSKRSELQKNTSNELPTLNDVLKGKIPKSVQTQAAQLAKETMKKFFLPAYWRESFSNYYLSGKLEMPTVPFLMEISIDRNGYKQLSLHISKSTTIDDLKANWPIVVKMQRMIKEMGANSIDDSQYAIYELRSKGISNEEVIKVLEEKYNLFLDSPQINTIFSRMKKLLG